MDDNERKKFHCRAKRTLLTLKAEHIALTLKLFIEFYHEYCKKKYLCQFMCKKSQ